MVGMKQVRFNRSSIVVSTTLLCLSTTVVAQGADSELDALREEIAHQRAAIERQDEELQQRLAELDALEQRLEAALAGESKETGAPEMAVAADSVFAADEPTLILTGQDLIADDFPGSFPRVRRKLHIQHRT